MYGPEDHSNGAIACLRRTSPCTQGHQGGGVTYEWTNITTSTTVTGTADYTPTVSGDYVVKAISESNAVVKFPTL